MPTECKENNHLQLEFQQAANRRVVADFKGGAITSDGGGGLLARQMAKQTGMLADLANCFIDHRKANQVDHPVEQLVSQRVLAIACG